MRRGEKERFKICNNGMHWCVVFWRDVSWSDSIDSELVFILQNSHTWPKWPAVLKICRIVPKRLILKYEVLTCGCEWERDRVKEGPKYEEDFRNSPHFARPECSWQASLWDWPPWQGKTPLKIVFRVSWHCYLFFLFFVCFFFWGGGGVSDWPVGLGTLTKKPCVWQKRRGGRNLFGQCPKRWSTFCKGCVEGDDGDNDAGHHLCVLRTQHELALVLRHLLLLNASLDLLNE